MTIKCNRCEVEKNHTKEFFKSKIVKGKEYLEKVCKECRNKAWILAKQKRMSNPDYAAKITKQRKDYSKKHYQNNKNWYKNRSQRLKDSYKQWKRDNYNPQKEKERHAKRMLNPTYKVSKYISNRIRQLIRDKDFASVIDLLDYSIQDLMYSLEKQFRDGMNWDNYGNYWHIDHIKPVSHFNFKSKNDPEFKQCWALSNLQPLLKIENLSKGNRFIG